MRRLLKLLLVAVFTVAPLISHNTPAYASSLNCFDKNGGSIGAEDFDIKTVQRAIGTTADGYFGPYSCSAVLTKLKNLGLLNNLSKSVWIDNTVLGWLGIIHPSVPDISAVSGAYRCNLRTTSEIKDIQNAIGAYVDGIFGPASCRTLRNKMVNQGLQSASNNNITFTDLTARSLGVDNNAADRVPCRIWGKCLLVDQTRGVNYLAIYTNGVVQDKVRVNTGMKGLRTRNGTYTLYKEHFAQDGVHISRDDNGNPSSGRMGDPLYFSGGQAFHWRVNYGSAVGSGLKANKSFAYADWQSNWENNTYTDNYASHGCVHTPHWVIGKYDSTHFQVGVMAHIADQPAN